MYEYKIFYSISPYLPFLRWCSLSVSYSIFNSVFIFPLTREKDNICVVGTRCGVLLYHAILYHVFSYIHRVLNTCVDGINSSYRWGGGQHGQ